MREERRLGAGPGEGGARLFALRVEGEVRRGDIEAGCGESFATGAADAAPGPGHQRDGPAAHRDNSRRTRSAARKARAATVSEGLTAPEVGRTLASTTKRLG